MKKMTLILALGLVFIIAGAAQGQMKMEFGFKAGANLANMTGDVDSTKMLIGAGGGVFARFMPTPQLTIQPEILYMMKGYEEDFTDGEKHKLNYIEVPVLLKYNIPMEGKVSPSIFAGPAVGMLLSAKCGSEDVKDSTKSIDFGVAFGAGVDIAMGAKGKLTFDARYTLGLANTNDTALADDYKAKNAVISVMVGYAFPIGGE